ncbi:FAD-dependent oxidoreductase [Dyadobacter chenwenxiniae]|uniref:FAD-dependent oxidoreductase n=1 Tax=Dyadobacter chenwenxiniae TaxID=2906456 RepID=A0A9X1PLF1_9BACT|nr:FAD-dependent oxidoreductase [Dyadobacter chenwenxiniae]MCF0063547.1 FAD-dependent oxidoreductase [Dyadobacter chenwenxiniae]UON83225.1 FAD-dependent oxidoreductase [Dyadobacter chenwenxiniae]
MIREEASEKRAPKTIESAADLVIVGGGLTGTCAAITAARAGVKVTLIQDRPVLGGNCSSEVRLWILGATSHMGNNNRWAREGGVIDEIMLENIYRNPDGNPLIFDTVLLEKVINEANITLLLNTAVYDLDKNIESETITAVHAFCSQNSTRYTVTAPLFCDASGDGIIGFLSGAAFRMGAESAEEFGEKFAPDKAYGELLGHSMYFYSKDIGRPVKFIPPSYALQDITEIPRYKTFNPKDFGCRLWWLEYGGRLDTVHDTEKIKWELWKVVYGAWNYIKNSGEFPESENMTLEWVGTIPGKRESRRFEGDYLLKQQDIVEQTTFPDTVGFGGWSLDLHPADGVYSDQSGCNQWHSKGVYSIPYRCFYSKNINNLFIAGRIISATHVAFASTRVMATSAMGGQAVAIAAAIAKKYSCAPREVGELHLIELQLELWRAGQYLPQTEINDAENLVEKAVEISASSSLKLKDLPGSDHWAIIAHSVAQMLPVHGKMPSVTVWVETLSDTELIIELRKSSKAFNHTPDVTLATKTFSLNAGKHEITLDWSADFNEEAYAFVCFIKNENIKIQYSEKRVTGLLTVFNATNPAVSNYGKQEPTEDLGVDTFEFWCPQRRPEGRNLAFILSEPIALFEPENLKTRHNRPIASPNAWVADFNDAEPVVNIRWEARVNISKIEICFDTDFDHPMENVIYVHPETVMPFCATDIEICNDRDEVVGKISGNHLSRRTISFDQPVLTQFLKIKVTNPNPHTPASLFQIRCY